MMSISRSMLLPVALCFLAFQAHHLVAQAQVQAKAQFQPHPQTPGPSQKPVRPLITKACEQANHKTFCINLLTSDKNSQKADLRGLAYIALRLAEKNATFTSVFIKQTLNKGEADSDGLTDCSERYITAVELIEDAISSLVSDKYEDVNNFAKAATADLNTCDASLEEPVGHSAEVANKNRDIRLLINTALTIVHVAASSSAASGVHVASSSSTAAPTVSASSTVANPKPV